MSFFDFVRIFWAGEGQQVIRNRNNNPLRNNNIVRNNNRANQQVVEVDLEPMARNDTQRNALRNGRYNSRENNKVHYLSINGRTYEVIIKLDDDSSDVTETDPINALNVSRAMNPSRQHLDSSLNVNALSAIIDRTHLKRGEDNLIDNNNNTADTIPEEFDSLDLNDLNNIGLRNRFKVPTLSKFEPMASISLSGDSNDLSSAASTSEMSSVAGISGLQVDNDVIDNVNSDNTSSNLIQNELRLTECDANKDILSNFNELLVESDEDTEEDWDDINDEDPEVPNPVDGLANDGNDVRFALDELLGLRGNMPFTIIKHVIWFLTFTGIYLFIFVYFPSLSGTVFLDFVLKYVPALPSVFSTVTPNRILDIVVRTQILSNKTNTALRLSDLGLTVIGYLMIYIIICIWKSIVSLICKHLIPSLDNFQKFLDNIVMAGKVAVILSIRIFVLPFILGLIIAMRFNILFEYSNDDIVIYLSKHLVGCLTLVWSMGISYMLMITLSVLQVREVWN